MPLVHFLLDILKKTIYPFRERKIYDLEKNIHISITIITLFYKLLFVGREL